jgi:hypothetical protein
LARDGAHKLIGVNNPVAGQWVNAPWQGVWQIIRVLPIANEMRFSLSENREKSRRVIVFLRRLVNAKWQKSFATRCCEQSLVRLLSSSDQTRLDCMLREDETLRNAFERYTPKPLDLVVNLSLGIPDPSDLQAFCETTLAPAMSEGISMDEALELLRSADLAQYVYKYPIKATLQMVCRDHETRDGEFVLRECRVLSG